MAIVERSQGRSRVAPNVLPPVVSSGNFRDEAHEIAVVIERLEKRFPDVPPQHVAEVTLAAHHELDGRPIRNYVPVLVERAARERLRRMATPKP